MNHIKMNESQKDYTEQKAYILEYLKDKFV